MKWGGDDKDEGLVKPSREHLPRIQGIQRFGVSLRRWGGEGLVRSLGLDGLFP